MNEDEGQYFADLALLPCTDGAGSLAACGTKDNDKMGDMSSNGSAMTGEPKNAEEALALHKELLEQENAHPVGKYRALGKGFHGGRQGHDHAARTAKTTATSCWIPSRPLKSSSPTDESEAG